LLDSRVDVRKLGSANGTRKCLTCEWSKNRVTQETVRTDSVTNSVEEREGNRPLGRYWLRWEDNFKTDVQEIGWGWTVLIRLRVESSDRFLVSTIMKLRVA
jgi:hypothetical protein